MGTVQDFITKASPKKEASTSLSEGKKQYIHKPQTNQLTNQTTDQLSPIPYHLISNSSAPQILYMTKKIHFPRFITALACLFALLFVGNAFGQTNNYFGNSGTITGNVWSTSVGGPYTSPLNTTGGAILNFNNAFSATGGNISPMPNTWNFGASVGTWSPGGTIGAAGVNINFNTSAGVFQDFGGSQSFSTSTTAAFTKSGTGALAWAGGTFTGGLTLSAGTLVLRGTSSLGSGAVTFNGGTIATNATRTISNPTSITIGGDLQLGEIPANVSLASNTANILFSDAVSLGTSTRTLTLGNAGTHEFVGVISGSGGLIVAANANGSLGTLILSGTNTYTGNTTITAGTLRAGSSVVTSTNGAFGNSANAVILNGGALEFNTSTFSRPLSVTANGSRVDAFSGARTASANISATGTFGLTIGGTTVASAAGQDLTLSGVLSNGTGTLSLTKDLTSTVILSNTNTYTGNTTITAGTLRVSNNVATSANGALGNSANAVVLNGGALEFNNATFSRPLSVTANGSRVDAYGSARTISANISATGTFGLTIGGTTSTAGQNLTLSGVLSNGTGTLSLIKNLNSPAILSNTSNNYTGGTRIIAGILSLGASGVLTDAGAISLEGGTFSTGTFNGFSETVGTLDLKSNSTIALGTGSHALTFAASDAVIWVGNTLTITGWGGTAGQSNTSGGRIFFSSATGLTAAQLAKISFSGYLGTPILLSSGELIPPAPSLTVTGTLAHGTTCVNTAASFINYTITNNGGTATISSITSNNAEFALSNIPATVTGGGGTATFRVIFTPTNSGARTATITVATSTANATVTQLSGSLSGTGTALPLITNITATDGITAICATTDLTANGVGGDGAILTWYTGAGGTGTNLGSANPLTNRPPGTYYARVTNTCAAEASITITFGLPAITSITGSVSSTSICLGTTQTLTANGVGGIGATVNWWTATGGTGTNLGTGTTLTNRGPGTYFARVTGTCTPAVETSITINAFPLPTLGTYSNTALISGANTTITPLAAPTNTTSLVAYTNSNFTGVLSADPATGVVRVTDAKQAGTYTVIVRATSSNGCTTDATFTLTVTNPICSQGLFTGTTNIAVGSLPFSVAIGDFNGDGKQDFAAANRSAATVSIRLGDGLGGFSGTTNIGVGTSPVSVAIGDFNGDGKQDFAAANITSGTVSIRLGDGLGGFTGSTNVGVGANPSSVAIGDFNGDGKQDFAAANNGSATVSIRLGDGLGGFSGTTNISVGSSPSSVAIGDFNGDGKQDFAAANFSSATVSIRLGDGLGGFSGSTDIGVGSNPNSVAIGDFNGDGNQDFAAANQIGTVSIRSGDGLGGFSGTTDIGVGSSPGSVAIGDFNGDGKQDFAAANSSSDNVSIRLGDGLGGFSGTNSIGVGSTPRSVAIGDFNGDGRQDFAAANSNSTSVSIRLGGINEINVQGNSTNIVDGDATPDLADHTEFGNTNIALVRTYTIQNTSTAPLTITSITLSGGDASQFTVGALTPASPIAASGSATFTVTFAPTSGGLKTTTVRIANDDCDEADYDFAIQGTAVQPTIGSYANTTITTGQNTTITPTVAPTNYVYVAASTNTNFTGLLSVNAATGAVTVTNAKQAGVYTITVKAINGLLSGTSIFNLTVNNPVATCQALFVGSTNVSVGSGPRSVAIGDFNSDGMQDIAVANGSTNVVSIRLGDGAGGFTGTTNVAVGTAPFSVAIGDFNGDGNQDFATANSSSNNVSIRLGNGIGGFSGTTSIAVGANPLSVATGDFNGDGKQDIAAVNGGINTVSIRLGDGLGGFSGSTDVPVGTISNSVAIGDFNGDGKQDFAAANGTNSGSSSTVSIRLGDGLGGFSGSTEVAVGSNPRSIMIGDFNGDGKQDFAVGNYLSSGTVSIRLGNGLGNFSGTTSVAVGALPYSIAIGDFNGDSRQDIAAANFNSSNVSIRLGDGLGGFSGTTNLAVGTQPHSVAIADFNGDGKQDFAAANLSSGTVSIRLGGGVNEINVQGNAIDIADGDATPSLADHTDFSSVAIGSSFTRTFTIQNTGTAALSITGTSVTGTNASEFVVTTAPATSVAAAGSTTFVITFTPTATGTRTATLSIANDDCDEAVYDFALQGTGCTNLELANSLDAATTSIVPGANPIFASGDLCKAIISITPNGANPVSGNVDSKVWVQATQPSFNGRPYLRRHYEITPATNAGTATARITLYATQAEFDAFNQFAFNGDDMPTGPGDNAGIANIRFYKYSGSSSDGSGNPGTYAQPGTIIDPANSDIVWNSVLSRWEISFDVTGFSGFFGGNGGNTILPLQLLNFNGSKQSSGTLLTWKTANEQNTKSFELESSTDGRSFIKIATLNAANNGSHTYSYTDATIYKDKVWYRLKMLDADGKFTYSAVVLMNQSTYQPITIFPNPAISVLNISMNSAKLLNTNAQLTDAKGSLLQVVRLSGYNQPVNIAQLAKGIYMIKFADGTVLRFVKE